MNAMNEKLNTGASRSIGAILIDKRQTLHAALFRSRLIDKDNTAIEPALLTRDAREDCV